MRSRDIIVIGGSSGGIVAMQQLVAHLPRNLDAAIFWVQHSSADSPGYLSRVASRFGSMPASMAEHASPIQPGRIYVAPPDHHLIITEESMRLHRGPRENRTRPAIDPLFRSAAVSHGGAVIGVVLSGCLDDGAAGLLAVKRCGGLTLTQHPDDALAAEMPSIAAELVEPDEVLNAAAIGVRLGELTSQPAGPAVKPPPDLVAEVRVVSRSEGGIVVTEELGKRADLSCPECGGPLWEIDSKAPRFRCHTGHAFTGRTLITGLSQTAEESLWAALRTLEERERMLRRMAARLEPGGEGALRHSEEADETARHARQIRELLGSI